AVAQAPDRLPVHLDVGDDIDLRQAFDEAPAVLLDRGPVEVPEAAAEGDQLLIAERLAAEQQHRMIVPGLDDALERGRVELAQIDAGHFGAERPAGRDHLNRPGAVSACGHGLGDRHDGHGISSDLPIEGDPPSEAYHLEPMLHIVMTAKAYC